MGQPLAVATWTRKTSQCILGKAAYPQFNEFFDLGIRCQGVLHASDGRMDCAAQHGGKARCQVPESTCMERRLLYRVIKTFKVRGHARRQWFCTLSICTKHLAEGGPRTLLLLGSSKAPCSSLASMPPFAARAAPNHQPDNDSLTWIKAILGYLSHILWSYIICTYIFRVSVFCPIPHFLMAHLPPQLTVFDGVRRCSTCSTVFDADTTRLLTTKFLEQRHSRGRQCCH